MEIENLDTERQNPNSMSIDRVPTRELVTIINNEDKKVAECIAEKLDLIAKAIDLASEKYKKGGRLIYMGAGTSGRLGILDAAELIPTYNISPERAFGLIAGGNSAIFKAVEGAEDNKGLAIADLENVNVSEKDIVIGIAASGRTPYVISGLDFAKGKGALTIAVTCNHNSEMSQIAQVGIDVPVGPEVVTGSTRMKAGSAQKMILNMLSTGIMIKTGKVYKNLMINVQATNEKLVNRGIRIVADAAHITHEAAEEVFEAAGYKVNVAIVMLKKEVSAQKAEKLIQENDGALSNFID